MFHFAIVRNSSLVRHNSAISSHGWKYNAYIVENSESSGKYLKINSNYPKTTAHVDILLYFVVCFSFTIACMLYFDIQMKICVLV